MCEIFHALGFDPPHPQEFLDELAHSKHKMKTPVKKCEKCLTFLLFLF